jgi:hypothetical protein
MKYFMEVNFPALKKAITMLPFAFMVHNAEEAVTMKYWMVKSPLIEQYPVSVQQFMIAAVLFTLLGFIVVFNKGIYKTEKQYLVVTAVFSGMLLLNVFFPHLVGAMTYRSYMPGLLTALAINFPLTVYILRTLRKHLFLNAREVILSIIVGGLAGIVLVKLFLSVGRLVEFI